MQIWIFFSKFAAKLIKMTKSEEKYLRLLSESFPNADLVRSELINLSAILSLPKGTEHFVSDLHGADTAFTHMLRNASGVVRKKVDEVYGDRLCEEEKRALCALIYYPTRRLALIHSGEFPIDPHNLGSGLKNTEYEHLKQEEYTHAWYRRRIGQVVEITRAITVKYSRSKVRKLLPKNFAYVIEELLHESSLERDRSNYYNAIIESIIETGCAEQLLIVMCHVIHSLTIDSLHIVGDIFDRGPGAEKIMDELMTLHDYDIQWGNHDIEWMGAAMGNQALIATVLRVSIRYANIETLEEGYGINLLPLANFAMDNIPEADARDPKWLVKDFENNPHLTRSAGLMARMHKAITLIQFKLEGQLIRRHPEWEMDDRVKISDIELTQEESELMEQLTKSFLRSEKLQKHLKCLLSHGSLYLVRNGFLLYHAAIPMEEDGSFTEADVCGKRVSGKALMDRTDEIIRTAYFGHGKAKQNAIDYMLYLWEGPKSPLFNKDKMTTYERYFDDNKDNWKEKNFAYYRLANERETCERILSEFGLNPETGRIINGHIPVKTLKGETPMRAEGKRFVIDGGFSKPYQEKTGIAGYTLIYNSHGIQLVEHESFESTEQAIRSGSDIHNRIQLQDFSHGRVRIADTDHGAELKEQIISLKQLLEAYENGTIASY